jgi:hypothetical protein
MGLVRSMKTAPVVLAVALCLLRARAALAEGPHSWPDSRPLPAGWADGPGPWNDQDDTTLWPNRASRANSDPALVAQHDQLRQMRPRLLLINLSNEHSRAHLDELTRQIVAGLAESSRYHGYSDPHAPAFLQYEVFRFVDLRDADRQQGDSRLVPVKNRRRKQGFNVDYNGFFSEEFARHYAVPDPRDPRRFLRLDELVAGGYVHEVWFFISGSPSDPHSGAYEVVEEKPLYDERMARVGHRFVQAGNGGDTDQRWTGRSVRIGCVNASRGPGCFLESLSHGLEGMGTSRAIPYFSRYFLDYAGYNLKEKHGLPVDTFYELDYD